MYGEINQNSRLSKRTVCNELWVDNIKIFHMQIMLKSINFYFIYYGILIVNPVLNALIRLLWDVRTTFSICLFEEAY